MNAVTVIFVYPMAFGSETIFIFPVNSSILKNEGNGFPSYEEIKYFMVGILVPHNVLAVKAGFKVIFSPIQVINVMSVFT
jgi:hypothetical protein